MSKTRWGGVVLAAASLVLAVAVAPTALAGKPAFERIDVEDTFDDEFLSEACGVAVTTHVEGHITVREFDRDKGVVELRTLNLRFTATAGDNSYRVHDVGADHVQAKADGSAIVLIIGQIPFDFTGVLKIDVATGDVLHAPQHDISGRLDDACEALTA
jgi:hypothetical protein